MSLLEQLEHRGVTAEDLERAAAVRLFEKAASAEGVNLDELSEQQVSNLFDHFTSNFHPTKEASTMNDEIVELFEKTAADEGIDLDEMSDEDLAELYNHYVENVLPEQIEEAEEDLEKEASIDEAHEKLAEAEILGRHMARAYVDELEKEAGKIPKSRREVFMPGKVSTKGEGIFANIGRRLGESGLGRRLGYEGAMADRQVAAGGKANQAVLDKALSKAETKARRAKYEGALAAARTSSGNNATTLKALEKALGGRNGAASRLTDSELSALRKNVFRDTDVTKATNKAQALAARRFNRNIGMGAAGGAATLAGGGALGGAALYNSMKKESSVEEIYDIAEDLASDIIADMILSGEI